MTNVDRYIGIAKFLADNMGASTTVSEVLDKASELMAMAGPQPRTKRQAKPTRAPKGDKTEAA